MKGRSWFTLKNVEGCVSQISGSLSPDINQWIGELADCAATVEWNPLQFFVYAKQLLTGAAKMFVRSQRNIKDWASLKSALVEEFGIKLSSAEVHRMLGKRRSIRVNPCTCSFMHLMKLQSPFVWRIKV